MTPLLPLASRTDLLAELEQNQREHDLVAAARPVSPEAAVRQQDVLSVYRWWDRELRADLAALAEPEEVDERSSPGSSSDAPGAATRLAPASSGSVSAVSAVPPGATTDE